MPLTRRNPRDPDSPFLTREAIGKGIPFRERFPGVDPKSIKVVCVPDEPVKVNAGRAVKRNTSLAEGRATTSIPLASDIVTKLRATGPAWPELADKIMRDGLKKLKQKAA